MPFEFEPLKELPDVILVKPRVFRDQRGWLIESYKKSDFERAGIVADFVQDNHSRSVGRGAVRGLHYQKEPKAQGKLVRCTRGEVFDVVVDIRVGSPTFGRFAQASLSEENCHMLWVPPGFAHGFCALTDVAEIQYKITAEYSPEHDRSILWNDPAIGIHWPVTDPVLSDKDAKAPTLAKADNNFTYRERSR